MVVRKNGRSFECVTLDLNTQRDFCDAGGRYPVANVADLFPVLRRMIAWTKRNGVPIVSSLDSHRPGEMPNGHPTCCIDGSEGQRKLDFTIFPSRIRVEYDNTLCVPLDLFSGYQQLIFRQRADDLLTNPKADRFLTHVTTEEFVVFGNTLEGAVKAVVLGLRAREKRVAVVVDACGYWNKAAADLAVRQMEAKGATAIAAEELLTRKLADRHRYRGNASSVNGHCHAEGNGKCPSNGNGTTPRLNGRLSEELPTSTISKAPDAGASEDRQ